MSNRSGDNIAKYLSSHHPDVYQEVTDKLQSIPCTPELVERVVNIAYLRSEEVWRVRLIATTAVLLLCSPESIHADTMIRKGVALTIADILGVSKQAIAKKLEQCRFYYTKTVWAKDTVNEILEEVRGDESQG
ncbi:hypothetical protein [Sphingobacterium sp. UBA2074]|uniref:hypothetical protein n=1 Tax=Sphingobacterium sp. UBA2074 TaxID=1947487 RepID=UPI00257E016B|nr:hypothetical protein [Sphingobacterium sp. UBA2074]